MVSTMATILLSFNMFRYTNDDKKKQDDAHLEEPYLTYYTRRKSSQDSYHTHATRKKTTTSGIFVDRADNINQGEIYPDVISRS